MKNNLLNLFYRALRGPTHLFPFLGCLVCADICFAEKESQATQSPISSNASLDNIPKGYGDLQSIPLFRDAYVEWQKASSQGASLDPIGVIWDLSLQTGNYLDIAQQLATDIDVPDETSGWHWAIPDIITILLIANQPEKAKGWIQLLGEFDDKLLVPLYPLFSIMPQLQVEGVDETHWKHYQRQAFPARSKGHIQDLKHILAGKEKYTHDQRVALLVEHDLLW